MSIRNSSLGLLTGLLLTIILIAACQTQPNQVFIEVDGGRQTLITEAKTVREALAEANVVLDSLDRVSPDLYAQLEQGLIIVVTRVREEMEIEREIIPFERQTIINEALAPGETRLAQLGANGEDEISIRVVYENSLEVSRTEVLRETVIEPVPEILVIGPQESLPSVPVEGTVAYISNGNAWLMRDSSGSRRALTTEGNLDSRVFSLSPDGRQLLFTTALTDEIELPLNELWLASTTIVGEQPITLGVQGILHAEWSPVISRSLVAYSTAERTANPPGWRANNDLWLLTPPATPAAGEAPERIAPEPVEILPPNTQGLYPWWGTTVAWSPDGTHLAYARADQIGVISLTTTPILSSSITPLLDFTPLQTFSEWVWVPGINWSPDGKFMAATVHGPPLASEPAEESQVFDLWLMSIDGKISVKVAEQVGMWANPVWGEAGITFGEAVNPLQSVNSRYTIQLIDRDGSNKRQIFPFKEETGVQFPELVWSPDGSNLMFIYNGNLHITSSSGGLPKQLTTDGQASHPQWALAQPLLMTGTLAITDSRTITGSGVITATDVISATPTAQGTRPRATVTPVPLATRTATATPTLSATRTAVPTSPAATPQGSGTIQPTDVITSPIPLETVENSEDNGP